MVTIACSYIIPFRAEPAVVTIGQGESRHGDRRLANLHAVLRWLAHQESRLEIIVVEQDAEPRLDPELLPPGCIHVFAYNDDFFNKSWAFNIGFRHAHGEVLALGDADMIIPGRNTLTESIATCRTDADAVKPYSRLIDLTPEETDQFLDSGNCFTPVRRGQAPDREGIGEFVCFCGGLFLIRRSVYDTLGGFDERFLGWGGEDAAMSVKIERLVPSSRVATGVTACHLYHERPRSLRYEHEHYARNVALLRKYRNASTWNLLDLCDSHRITMGDKDKYTHRMYSPFRDFLSSQTDVNQLFPS